MRGVVVPVRGAVHASTTRSLPPASGGSSRDERFAQRGTRTFGVGALGAALENRFDEDSFHCIHRSLGWPTLLVSVAPHHQFALWTA
jgi:hypothetical protein